MGLQLNTQQGAIAGGFQYTGAELEDKSLTHQSCCNQYQISVARSNPELESLRAEWENRNRNPNSQIDFFRLINECRASVARPHVIAVIQNRQIEALVIGRIVEQEFQASLGYRTFSFGKVRQLDIVHGGILGIDSAPVAEVVYKELLRALSDAEADVVHLSHADTRSALYQVARNKPSILRRDWIVQKQCHWKAELPGTLDEFLKRLNKKHRAWLRRMEKLFANDFTGKIRFQSFAEFSSLEELADNLETVASKSYQRALGAGFVKNGEQLRRLQLARDKDWLRGVVLFANDTPCAYWMGTLYKGVFFSEATSFDPQFRKYEVGTQVFVQLVASLCKEGAHEIDFGLGDALYKQRFGQVNWEDGTVRIFARSMRAIRLNLTKSLLERAALGIRFVFRKAGLEQRLKTIWRRRLTDD
jgi:hypothetical protein